jgi:hypothetical protein
VGNIRRKRGVLHERATKENIDASLRRKQKAISRKEGARRMGNR